MKVKLPAVVGLPDNTPAALRLNPGGKSAGTTTSHVIGAVPVAEKAKLYAVPTVPFGGAPDVMVGATSAVPVCANCHDSVTELAFVPGNVTFTVAALPFIVPANPVGNVCPVSAINVMDAVYTVLAANVVPVNGDHVTALAVKFPVAVAAFDLIAPVNGVCTFVIAALFIGAGAVDGNWNDNVTALPVLFKIVALLPFMVTLAPAAIPVNV